MKIMVCTDGTKPSEKAIEVAAKYASISNSELMILHVIESEVRRESSEYDSYGEKLKAAQTIVDSAVKLAAEFAPDATILSKISVGPVSAEIVRIAEENGFGALFVGATGGSKIKKNTHRQRYGRCDPLCPLSGYDRAVINIIRRQ